MLQKYINEIVSRETNNISLKSKTKTASHHHQIQNMVSDYLHQMKRESTANCRDCLLIQIRSVSNKIKAFVVEGVLAYKYQSVTFLHSPYLYVCTILILYSKEITCPLIALGEVNANY